MRRHHLNLLSLWILPLLVLRALIPTGFMLSAHAGELQLMFCPSGVVQPLGSSKMVQQHAHAEHHQGMHHDGADQSSPSHDIDNAPCPFSLVASAAVCDIPHLVGVAEVPRDERFTYLSAPTFRVGPVRTDRIRGPPSLA
ncbi:hypothetical protein [Steroidobacter cummioxidans]|uniref:hypothetical protein n=1 Tax=Steroidobacter cummioxidans TaxID=1803913 RepID=UPI000E30ECBB|nr:hypothetical protein [Steroidobacter cummioxidans]